MTTPATLLSALGPLLRDGEVPAIPAIDANRLDQALRLAKGAAAAIEGETVKGAPANFVELWLQGIADAEDGTFTLAAQWSGLLAAAARRYRKPMDKHVKKLAGLTHWAGYLFKAMFQHVPEGVTPEPPQKGWGEEVNRLMLAELAKLPLARGSFVSDEGPGAFIGPRLSRELVDLDLGMPAAIVDYGVPNLVWVIGEFCGGGLLFEGRADSVGVGNSANLLVKARLAERHHEYVPFEVGPLPGEKAPREERCALQVVHATKAGIELWELGRDMPSPYAGD